MPKRLWDIVDGEPYMVNPRLGILGLVNPKKSKSKVGRRTKRRLKNSRKKLGGSTMARRSGKARMAWVRSFRKKGRKNSPRRRTYHAKRRRSRARRNPYPMAGLALNPRRRRRSHKRRSMRRNPSRARRYAERGLSIMGVSLPPLQAVLYAGIGFVGTPLLESYINPYLPLSITSNTLGKYAVRIGSVLGLTWLAKAVFGPQQARMVGIGGGAYVLVTAVKEFAPGVIPGLSAYVPAGPRGLSSYVPSTRQLSAGGVPVFGGAGSRSNRFSSRFTG